MPNENKYRYRHGLLNPVLADEDTYAKDNPNEESDLDRLHRLVKPPPGKVAERTSFVGHVLRVINNLGLDDLSVAQQAVFQGNPNKIKSFVVRIPESFSAAIPESLNLGGKKKNLDDIYSQLETEVVFILQDANLPSPGLGDLVRCDYLVRNEPSQGGVIKEILGKQGNRSKNMLAGKKDTEASDAHAKEGQTTELVTPQDPLPDPDVIDIGEQLKNLTNPYTVAETYINKSFKVQKSGYSVTNFIEAIIFDIKKKIENADLPDWIKQTLIEGYNPKSSGKFGKHLPLSYYANFAWANPKDISSGKNTIVRRSESAGAVYWLMSISYFRPVSPKGETLQEGDIINIWTRPSGKWINSTAVVESKHPDADVYNLIGSAYWTDVQNASKDIVIRYTAEIKNTEDTKFWICRGVLS